MSAVYMHVGIPVTTKKEGMVYNDDLKLWLTENPDQYDYKIEYLKFEEGTPFPEIMHKNPHVAYQVDNMQPYLDDADEIIFGPVDAGGGARMAFIIKNETIFELYESK